ncbi:MAG: penicillin-binding protein [Candidatus Hydrogenedentota bacterium]
MAGSEDKVPSAMRRMQARGCGFLFFLFMLAIAAAFGGGLGVFVWKLEDAKSQIAALDTYRPKVGSKVYSADGVLLGEYNEEFRQLVRLSEIPLMMQKAVVAAEDAVFYEHKGVRPDAIFNAVLFILRTGELRGGSTITQQLVRNAESATGVSTQQTLTRKMQEAVVALQVEREFTKDEILELYLNQVFFGGSAHGVEAAAQQYFMKSCRDLTLEECATLAGILRSPNNNRPDRYPERAEPLRNLVLDQMLEHGFITPEQRDAARATKVADYVFTPEERQARLAEDERLHQPNRFKAPYFVEEMRQQGVKAGRFSKDILLEQGLEIRTTLDYRLQKAAEEALYAELDAFDERKRKALERQGKLDEFVPVSGALICMDNRRGYEGYVRALVGGRNWDEEKFNHATQALRQPGSSVKPFIWAAAFEAHRNSLRLSPASIEMDSPYVKIGANGVPWSPRNFSGDFSGPVTLRYALEKSINVVAVRLAEKTTVPVVKSFIQKMGFNTRPIPDSVGLTIALGTYEVTPIEQCAAYSVFAKGGIYTPPTYIHEILDRDGLVRYRADIEREQVIDPDLAYLMVHLLRGTCESAWGTGGRTSILKRPRAGKTGTTNAACDVWFCGFTPEYTTVVWIGYSDNRRSLGSGADYTGGRRAAPVWANFMLKALEGQPVQDFVIPEDTVEWHTVERQTSRGWQGGFKEAFLPGTYRVAAPPSPPVDALTASLEAQMEVKTLETAPPTNPVRTPAENPLAGFAPRPRTN